MSSAWAQLEQMLTCAICLDKFKNPRLLPCQHSFCGDACMEGLVDYARRQIKCPECRAEHRIPYQGVQSLPSNVTLIRFLELHSRITGEEPEPVPTFMEKCSVCGEKVEGVRRCWHCEKKVCPECREAHVDLLRREVARTNGQTRRCLSRLNEIRDSLDRCEERLRQNKRQVRGEIEESCRRLVEDLKAKQQRLLDEVDQYSEQELATLAKLRQALQDELQVLESNGRLAEEKLGGGGSEGKLPWSDQEMQELKEIYARAMEFARLFDPELGDYSRKIRFQLVPEFDSMRRRLCELGELRLAESGAQLVASSLQACQATGLVAQELLQQAQQQQQQTPAGNLSQSNSSSQLATNTLELPQTMMQNALMRSQSDHRLASQFQQKLKQQQQQQQQQFQDAARSVAPRTGARYTSDYGDPEAAALRSRYAPPRTTNYGDLLTRDWPRPSDDAGAGSDSFAPSIHFKSAFMRRKEKERQGGPSSVLSGYTNDDDDDLASEASYATAGARNVRFHEPEGLGGSGRQQPAVARLFEGSIAERAPLSGLPKLEESAHLLARLHEMGARAKVDKRLAEEEGRRDKDLVESARQSVSRASERLRHQPSEDEIERQKRQNKAADETGNSAGSPACDTPASAVAQPTDTPATVAPPPAEEAPAPSNARRSLYGQAVTERSRRQLSSALQEQRRASGASRLADDTPSASSAPETVPTSAAATSARPRRPLRSTGRSQSGRSQSGGAEGSQDSPTTTVTRRRRLARAGSSNSNSQEPSASGASSAPVDEEQSRPARQPKNAPGSGGGEDEVQQQQVSGTGSRATTRTRKVASAATTDEEEEDAGVGKSDRLRYQRRGAAEDNDNEDDDDDDDDDQDDDGDDQDDDDDISEGDEATRTANLGKRRSREMLPQAVNKLLDRSAQIRRDSQEQRSRADSPQRTSSPAPKQSSFYRPGGAYSAATRQRLAYQRSSGSTRDSRESGALDDGPANNSSNSIYTTASSAAGRQSQDEAETPRASYSRRLSGTGAGAEPAASSSRYLRRDSSGETPAYQSRFLSRSRTSAALAGASSSSYRSQESREEAADNAGAYLSSRERFMQSASVAAGRAGSQDGPATPTASTPTSTNLYSRGGGGGGQSAGIKTHSEYLRNKFRRTSSSSNSSSAPLSRSRSSQALALGRSEDADDGEGEEEAAGADDNQEGSAAYAHKRRLLFKLGSRGSQPGNFTWPRGVAVGVGGGGLREIVVADSSNHRVQVFDQDGRFLSEFGTYGSEPGQFDCLAGVAINQAQRLYVVSDRYNHRVQVFDFDGVFRNSFGEFGREPGKLNLPWGVACDPSGLVYVCDKENHRVQVFEPDGRPVLRFGSAGQAPGQLQHPHYIAVGLGRLAVTDTNNHRVQLFDLQGRLLRAFGCEGSRPGEFKFPRGIAMDELGRLVVGDSGNNRLQVFSAEGHFLKALGTWGSADGEFKGIEGVAVDTVGHQILVCDRENHRIQVF